MPDQIDGIGSRLRAAREGAGMSQRELARRLEVSASLISQVESGASQPSVGTLYGIVTELGLSFDGIFRAAGNGASSQVSQSATRFLGSTAMVRASDDRKSVELESGVRWEQLAGDGAHGIDFVLATYEPGASSAPEGTMMRHAGREYGMILSGRLGVQIDDERYELFPGDSISYESSRPHRLWNLGDDTARTIWIVVDAGINGR